MVAPPPESGQDYNKLALDVASVIMGSFMRRSESITRLDSPVAPKGCAKSMGAVEMAKGRLRQFCEEQERLLSSMQEVEQMESVKGHLEELRPLMIELVHGVSQLDDRPAPDLSKDISHLRSLFDQLIDENLSLEKECEEKDTRLQLHLQHEDSTDSIRSELQCQIVALTRRLDEKNLLISGMAKDHVDLLKTAKKDFASLRELIDELCSELAGESHPDSMIFKEDVLEVFNLQKGEIEKVRAENMVLSRGMSQMDTELLESVALIENLKGDLQKSEQDKQLRVISLIEENEDIIRTLNDTNTKQLLEVQQSYEDQLSEKDRRCNQYNDQIVRLSEQLNKLEADLEKMGEEKKRMADELATRNHGTPPSKRARSSSITGSTGTPTISNITGSAFGSSLKNLAPLVPPGQMRVVFTGYRDQTGPKSVKYLGGLVERLGGVVHVSDIFSEQITHVVSPKGCNSIKVLAGSLTAKWLVSEDWLIESANSDTFLPEINFSGRKYVEERPFRAKTIYMTPAFQAQQLRHQFDVSCCRTLIENLGKGRLVRDSNSLADYVLVADTEPTTSERISLRTFLSMIPGYCPESR